jgi:hypothetical protein
MHRFQTVIRSARFVYSPYTATEMQGFAQVLADSIRTRIQSGQKHLRPGSGPAQARTGGPAFHAAVRDRPGDGRAVFELRPHAAIR